MGVPVVVIGNKHICPMTEGLKPHVGGPVNGPGISGVTINGKPVAVEGDKCTCTGGSSPDEIVMGCQGVLVDGKPIAILGSMTQHGGIIIEGVPGVTISGPLVSMATNPKELEPKIFNLQWRRKEDMTHSGKIGETLVLSADTVGYEDDEEVAIKIYEEGNENPIDEVKGTVKDNRVEVEWELKRK